MFNVSRKDYNCLLNMRESIDKINAYSAGFTSAEEFDLSGQAFDASLMHFIVIGEMVEKLTDALKDTTADRIDWFRIKGFRNILAHDYFGVNAKEVWHIIQNDLPELGRQVDKLLAV